MLGLASGIGAPMSGRLTDKFGPKVILGLGALVSVGAAAAIIWWVLPHPSMTSVIVSLALARGPAQDREGVQPNHVQRPQGLLKHSGGVVLRRPPGNA